MYFLWATFETARCIRCSWLVSWLGHNTFVFLGRDRQPHLCPICCWWIGKLGEVYLICPASRLGFFFGPLHCLSCCKSFSIKPDESFVWVPWERLPKFKQRCSFKITMLAGSRVLEEFIDHIESDGVLRLHWLQRIRESGFDQALSEYRESLICSETIKTTICEEQWSHFISLMYLIALEVDTSSKSIEEGLEKINGWYKSHGFHHFLCHVNG